MRCKRRKLSLDFLPVRSLPVRVGSTWQQNRLPMSGRLGLILAEAKKPLSVSDLAELLANHKLGKKDELMRQLRYFTSEGLLETAGAVHTGSGRKRQYSQEALVKAVVLSRLFQSGATVGLMKAYVSVLEEFMQRKYNTKNLLVACSTLKRPTVYLALPDERYKIAEAGLFDWEEAVKIFKPNVDFLAIQIGRFL
jgi:hypothetical protein